MSKAHLPLAFWDTQAALASMGIMVRETLYVRIHALAPTSRIMYTVTPHLICSCGWSSVHGWLRFVYPNRTAS